MKNVVNLDELKLEHGARGDRFEWRGARIGPLVGARDLGYSYDVLPPGKANRVKAATRLKKTK